MSLPPWPETPPAADGVLLRPFADADLSMVLDSATDPYIPLIGTLPAQATVVQAEDWMARQRGRWAAGRGFSFAVAEDVSGRSVGAAGLWLGGLPAGQASAGYSIAPRDRGRGLGTAALRALTGFAWSLPGLRRVELEIEPDNTASIRTAVRAGYTQVGTSRRHLGSGLRDMDVFAATRPH